MINKKLWTHRTVDSLLSELHIIGKYCSSNNKCNFEPNNHRESMHLELNPYFRHWECRDDTVETVAKDTINIGLVVSGC